MSKEEAPTRAELLAFVFKAERCEMLAARGNDAQDLLRLIALEARALLDKVRA